MNKTTKEQQLFALIQHWEPERKILPPEHFLSKNDPLYPLFLYLYRKTQTFYQILPLRKNGETSFTHPLNTVQNLCKAKISDAVIICAGIIHDLVEEKVDLYKREKKIIEDLEGIRILDHYEQEVFKKLEQDLTEFCIKKKILPENAQTIIAALKLLTRHKRHSYYSSIACIFNCPDHRLKKIAIKIKLADRIHNILSIECFTKQERIYQCFKNIFILNNTKQFLMNRYGKKIFTHTQLSSTEYLFNKCSRATYDAFLNILSASTDKDIAKIKTLLQLSFKKYEFEISGLSAVTKFSKKNIHPMRLFQDILKKYDKRLHLEWDKLDEIIEEERIYCKKFFCQLKFNNKQIQSILDYKDAFALKELVARLMYQYDYLIVGFLISEVSPRGRISSKKIN